MVNIFTKLQKNMLSAKILARSFILLVPSLIGLTAIDSNAAPLPTSGTILKMTNGDLMCYLELKDSKGKEQQVGAIFEICEQSQKFLNKKVTLTYKKIRVNDCQSAEPCGKTRKEMLVVKLKLIR
jgi:hypothetical protein